MAKYMMIVSSVLVSLLAPVDAPAIIIHNEVAGGGGEIGHIVANNPALQGTEGSVPAFSYGEHVGMVGMGSGIYLGDGYVLTSAHVGCHPFRMGDESNYKPHYASWRILDGPAGSKSDLAIFRVEISDTRSSLANLGWLPVGKIGADSGSPLILIGTGFGQQPNAVAHQDPEVVLGYEILRQRKKRWGIDFLDKVLNEPVATAGGYLTHCFVSTFERLAGHAQAADGDSGGAVFAYNSQLGQWEVVGCIIAVSQLGSYVPFGSRTYVGDLGCYEAQLPQALPTEI